MNASRPAAAARGRDLTSGPIFGTLILFALPTLGANVLQSLNGSINAVWIGRFLGEGALAATSNANIVMFLMFALGFGFGMAATVIVGQRIGARDLAGARAALGTTVGLFAILSVAIAIAGWWTTPALLKLLATPAGAEPFARAYLRVIFLGLPPMFLGVLLQMALRGAGDSLTPLWCMILGAVLDAGLNPVLILGLGPAPRMGIAGSATATLISSYTVLACLVAAIYARDLPIRLRGREWRYLVPDPALLRLILAKGLPMGLQMIVMSLSSFAMIGLVNRRGVDVTAAYGVAQQIWGYIQMPAMAIGVGVSAMAAQNIGAGRWDRIGRVAGAGVIANVAMTGTLIVALILFDRPLLGLFLGAQSPAVAIASHIQLVVTWSFLTFGVTFVLFATMRANGAVVAPLVILTLCLLFMRVGLALALMPRDPEWLWWCFPISSLATTLLAAAYYFQGGWRRSSMAMPAAEAAVRAEAVQEPGGRLHATSGGDAGVTGQVTETSRG